IFQASWSSRASGSELLYVRTSWLINWLSFVLSADRSRDLDDPKPIRRGVVGPEGWPGGPHHTTYLDIKILQSERESQVLGPPGAALAAVIAATLEALRAQPWISTRTGWTR